MRRGYLVIVLATGLFSGFYGGQLLANQTATWDGTSSNQWHEANWTFNSTPAQTANAVTPEGNVGGRGGIDWVIGNGAQVTINHNRGPNNDGKPFDPDGQGDFKPRKDVTPSGSITVKQGAAILMDSHTDTDGRWSRISVDMTLDNGLWRRTFSAPSQAGGKIIFGHGDELLANQKIDIKLLNGGRIENDGKMIFGEPDYFPPFGGNNGHQDGIEIAMTINNGSLDLTGGGYADYPFGYISGELIFAYEYHQNVGPRNEKYSINFTGPGSITVDPHYDETAAQYLGGIYAVRQRSDGGYDVLGNNGTYFDPIGYQDLWNLGILQANGLSGLTGANFNTYFTVTGDQYHENYTLTSLVAPPGVAGDYNNNGVVDAADYVLWRNGGPLQNEVDLVGTVNAADYAAWRARFGNVAGSGAGLGAAAVPEPASLWLVCGAVGIIITKLLRSRR